MGLNMLSHMTAYPVQEVLYLLFPVPSKPRLRRPALLMAGVHQARSRLAIHNPFALTDADTVRPQSDQYQDDKEVMIEKGTQRPNIIAVSDVFFSDWEWRQNQALSRQTPEKHRPSF